MPATTPRAARWRRAAANAALLVVGLAVALGLSEAVVRRFAPQPRPLTVALHGLHVPDPELGYVMAPGFHRKVHGDEFECDLEINSLGMRDREPGPRVPGKLRILGVGDSFVFGVHAGALENCFLKRLEAELRTELQSHPITDARGRTWNDVEILDAGVDGYGTEQEVGLLERLGPKLEPDAVLLGFYLGNDFTDNSGRTRMTVVDGYQMLAASAAGYREHFGRPDRKLRLWLHAHSELYTLLKSRLLSPAQASVGTPAAGATGAAQPKSFDYYIYDSGFADCLRSEPSPQLARALRATQESFVRLHGWCEAHATSVLIVALPAEQQVSATARQRWIARFGLAADSLDFGLPTRRLQSIAHDCGLPCFDLGPGFATRISAGADLHLHADNHWNAAGHAAAAELLLPAARQLAGARELAR